MMNIIIEDRSMARRIIFGIHRCANTVHKGCRLHWTRGAQSACTAEQARLNASQSAQPEPSYSLEDKERDRKKFEAELTKRTLRQPVNQTEAAFLRIAERQTPLIAEGWFKTLDMLLTNAIRPINRNLRRGESVRHVPAALDVHGFSSVDLLLEQATSLFDSLGPSLNLDEHLVFYRGVALSEADSGDDDIWRLRTLLTGNKELPRGELEDPGFLFATPLKDAALQHLQRSHGGKSSALILFEMTVRQGLCIPGFEIASDTYLRRVMDYRYLRHADSQIVIPRNSRWRMLEAQQGAKDKRLIRIRLDQIIESCGQGER